VIDDSDGDFALLMSSALGPIGGVLMLILAGCLYYAACQNEKDCRAKSCQVGESAQLLDHECVCVSQLK